MLGARSPYTAITTTPSPPLALDVLGFIVVANEHQDGYSRDLFVEGVDEDGDGGATRAEVLIRDALAPPQLDGACNVGTEQWLSVYDGAPVTDPVLLQVDHVVALDEAWDSGAWRWDGARRAELRQRSRRSAPDPHQFDGNADGVGCES